MEIPCGSRCSGREPAHVISYAYSQFAHFQCRRARNKHLHGRLALILDLDISTKAASRRHLERLINGRWLLQSASMIRNLDDSMSCYVRTADE